MENAPNDQGTARPTRHMCQYPGCEKTFIRKEHLTRHERSHASQRSFVCYVCQRGFTRKFVSPCSAPLTASCICSTYTAIIILKCLYRSCKLSWLTLSTLVIFFGAISFDTTILLEPLHGMGALVTDATAVRSSVKVGSHARLVSRGEWSANSKEMKWPSLEMHPRIVQLRMIMILVVMVSTFLV